MDEAERLVPSSEKAVFLIAVPPKSFRHDQHKCLQLQRIIHHSTESSGLRIRPIFNLEYHRLFATRIIELEHDDVKVAEFHPRKVSYKHGRRGSEGDNRVSTNGAEPKPRRHRAFSIDNKAGANGGRISTHTSYRGLCEMTVTGSERDGHFHFQAIDGHSLSWTRLVDAPGCQWKLDREDSREGDGSETETLHLPTNLLHDQASSLPLPPSKTAADRPRTSYEFLKDRLDVPLTPPRIARTKTAATMGSQYTTNFANESQLSGLTNSPGIDELLPPPKEEEDGNHGTTETILSSLPLPHLSVGLLDHDRPRASMREIRESEDRLYRTLLTALWLTWASDIVHDATTTTTTAADAPESPNTLAMADRQSRHGRSEALPSPSPVKDAPTAAAAPDAVKKKRRGGLLGLIARVCGG